MRLFQNPTRRNRWLTGGLVAGLLANLLLAVSLITMRAAAQEPSRTFSADAGLILNYIKPASTTDFEAVMRKLADAIQNSENADLRNQGNGWKLFRAREPGPNNDVLYVMSVDPAIRGAEYSVAQILARERPQDVQQLYDQFNDSFGMGQNVINLELVLEF